MSPSRCSAVVPNEGQCGALVAAGQSYCGDHGGAPLLVPGLADRCRCPNPALLAAEEDVLRRCLWCGRLVNG